MNNQLFIQSINQDFKDIRKKMSHKEKVEKAIQDMKSPIDNDTLRIKNLTDWLNQQEVKKKTSEKWYETMHSPKNYSKPEVKLLKATQGDLDFAKAMAASGAKNSARGSFGQVAQDTLTNPSSPSKKQTSTPGISPSQRFHELRTPRRRATLNGPVCTPTSSQIPAAASVAASSAHVARWAWLVMGCGSGGSGLGQRAPILSKGFCPAQKR